MNGIDELETRLRALVTDLGWRLSASPSIKLGQPRSERSLASPTTIREVQPFTLSIELECDQVGEWREEKK